MRWEVLVKDEGDYSFSQINFEAAESNTN